MSRLLSTYVGAVCLLAGAALNDSAGFGGGPSNAERKRIRDRKAVHPPVEIAGDNLPGETNRQFAERMKARTAATDKRGGDEAEGEVHKNPPPMQEGVKP